MSLASVKSRLVLPFWYWLTRVVPEKGQLNVCSLRLGMAVQQNGIQQKTAKVDMLSDDRG